LGGTRPRSCPQADPDAAFRTALLDGLLVGDEDAEGMTVQVRVDPQRLIRMVRASESHCAYRRQDAVVHGLQVLRVLRVPGRQIQMELLQGL
jgi:hypothetical protein